MKTIKSIDRSKKLNTKTGKFTLHLNLQYYTETLLSNYRHKEQNNIFGKDFINSQHSLAVLNIRI